MTQYGRAFAFLTQTLQADPRTLQREPFPVFVKFPSFRYMNQQPFQLFLRSENVLQQQTQMNVQINEVL